MVTGSTASAAARAPWNASPPSSAAFLASARIAANSSGVGVIPDCTAARVGEAWARAERIEKGAVAWRRKGQMYVNRKKESRRRIKRAGDDSPKKEEAQRSHPASTHRQ